MNGRVGTTIPMQNERLTVFEAISQSGAQDPYDRKDEIWLVRRRKAAEEILPNSTSTAKKYLNRPIII